MKNILTKKFLLSVCFVISLAVLPRLASAAIVTNTNPESLDDGVQLMVNVAQWILGIVGSLTLLMFVIGGFMFLISAGNSQTVEKGKSIIIGSVVGLVIVFCSYMIIQFSMSAIGLKWSGTTATPTAATPEKCDVSFGKQGYRCMDSIAGTSCKQGYCTGAKNIQCCLPN